MLTLVDALLHPRRCHGDCHTTLTVEQRTRAVEALYVLDDALRGWGYTPLYEIHGDVLWQEAQQRGDPGYRGVAVRFGECVYRRLVGAMIHEAIHASFGDTTKANYGVPFGLPYGVPETLAERDEEAYLAPFNFDEARAFGGVASWTTTCTANEGCAAATRPSSLPGLPSSAIRANWRSTPVSAAGSDCSRKLGYHRLR